jgi:uncharacterized protein (DUF1786 family)
MKILVVDVGTGTQDVLLWDTRLDVENGFKLILPSPTMRVRQQIQAATRRQQPVALSGVMMGGGPNAWAAEDHVRAGLPLYATPDAARSFNDDLAAVAASGVTVIGTDELTRLPEQVAHIELRDFDFAALQTAFGAFGVPLDDLAAVGVAVFDHGAAPPDVSDRQFRFNYLDERIRAANRLSAFAYPRDAIPPMMTRLQAVATSAAAVAAPLVVMDTAPAAVLGATFDPRLAGRERLLVANVGNFHTLAFRLGPSGIEGVFEHHTGLLDAPKLESLLRRLADGSLTHAEVFADHGHGALIYAPEPFDLARGDFGVAVTGPRRAMLQDSPLRPYFAVPFGDMMIAGCFGLLAAMADLLPELHDPIQRALHEHTPSSRPPWELSA